MKKIKVLALGLMLTAVGAVYAAGGNSNNATAEYKATVEKSDGCCSMANCCAGGSCQMGGSCCSAKAK